MRDDSLGRLRLIGCLHDWENMKKHIENWDYNTEMAQDIDSLTWAAFFPKLSMSFSPNENPLRIANSLEKMGKVLKKELLLF